jgi:hypothetical protein
MYSLGDSTQKEYKKKNSKEHFLIGLLVPRWISGKWGYSFADFFFSLSVIGLIIMSMGGSGRGRR